MAEVSMVHGFKRHVDFLKATLSLGVMITLGLWAILTYALDGRYWTVEDASAHLEAFGELRGQVGELTGTVAQIRKQQLVEAIMAAQVLACKTTGQTHIRYTHDVHNLSLEYKTLTGEDPFVPDCSDLSNL